MTLGILLTAGALLLSFWWWMGSYETLLHHDWFGASLYSPEGTLLLSLAFHDDQAIQQQWQQDVVDVSAYAGQTLTLRFEAYNDNYYFTWFDLDEVCLRSVERNCPAHELDGLLLSNDYLTRGNLRYDRFIRTFE